MQPKWAQDLPPAVASAFERLVRTTESLPKPPKRSTLGLAMTVHADTTDSAVSVGVGTSRPGTADMSCSPKPKNRSAQCDFVADELTAARERVMALEARLAARSVEMHLHGADRVMMDELLSRRSIESHHDDLLSFITSSWTHVRSAMSQAAEAWKHCQAAELRSVEAEGALRRTSEHLASAQRLNESLKELLETQSKVADDVAVARAEAREQTVLRAAAELRIAKISQDKKRYKQRALELEESVLTMRQEVDGLTSRHQSIVSELEQSLRQLVLGGSTSADTHHCDNTTLVEDVSQGLTSAADSEKKKVMLRFELQDALKELQESKAVIRSLRASLASDALAKQKEHREWHTQRTTLEKELKRMQQEKEALKREVKLAEGTAKELGKCRGLLSIAQKRLAELECETPSPSKISVTITKSPQRAPLSESATEDSDSSRARVTPSRDADDTRKQLLRRLAGMTRPSPAHLQLPINDSISSVEVVEET